MWNIGPSCNLEFILEEQIWHLIVGAFINFSIKWNRINYLLKEQVTSHSNSRGIAGRLFLLAGSTAAASGHARARPLESHSQLLATWHRGPVVLLDLLPLGLNQVVARLLGVKFLNLLEVVARGEFGLRIRGQFFRRPFILAQCALPLFMHLVQQRR